MLYYKDIENFVKGKKVFCGIDVHLKFWVVCFFCDGEVIEQSRRCESAIERFEAERENIFGTLDQLWPWESLSRL